MGNLKKNPRLQRLYDQLTFIQEINVMLQIDTLPR